MQVSTFLGHWVNLNFIERIMMAYHIVSLGEKNELNGKSTDPKNTNRYPLASLLMHNTIVRKDIFVTIALLLILIYIYLLLRQTLLQTTMGCLVSGAKL